MSWLKWRIRKPADIEIITYMRKLLPPNEPRNVDHDPAFGDFNLPLPEQLSPGTTGTAIIGRQISQTIPAIENTPTNDRLRELAAKNPPPPEWFEGEEEDLF